MCHALSSLQVTIGTNISQALERRLSYTGVGEALPLEIIIPSVVGGFAVMVILLVLVMCCIICGYQSKHKKTEQRWTNLLAQMELLEIEMADECKRGNYIVRMSGRENEWALLCLYSENEWALLCL